jgi:predicted NodU family carbamoyl transferase
MEGTSRLRIVRSTKDSVYTAVNAITTHQAYPVLVATSFAGRSLAVRGIIRNCAV